MTAGPCEFDRHIYMLSSCEVDRRVATVIVCQPKERACQPDARVLKSVHASRVSHGDITDIVLEFVHRSHKMIRLMMIACRCYESMPMCLSNSYGHGMAMFLSQIL
jgi:hypothetical protein